VRLELSGRQDHSQPPCRIVVGGLFVFASFNTLAAKVAFFFLGPHPPLLYAFSDLCWQASSSYVHNPSACAEAYDWQIAVAWWASGITILLCADVRRLRP
jgi:hypothetical protein